MSKMAPTDATVKAAASAIPIAGPKANADANGGQTASGAANNNAPGRTSLGTAWHSKDSDLEDRKLMAKRILNVLVKSNTKAPSNWDPQEVARRLEHSLYHLAASKEAYLDITTLRERLQSLLNNKKQAAAQRPPNGASSNGATTAPQAAAANQARAAAAASSGGTSSKAVAPMGNAGGGRGSKESQLQSLQQRLILLKHARLCQKPGTCGTQHCMYFKNILAHIAVCKLEKCTVAGCTMAKQLLTHYKLCRNFKCELCNAIRKPMDKSQQAEVLRRQQERLCLLRHASICQANSGVPGAKPCSLPYCEEMKALWNHICKCTDRSCTYNHCISSRYVLSHFKECRNQNCEVCAPVRRAIKVADGGGGSIVKQEPGITAAAGGASKKRTASQAELSAASASANKRQIKTEPTAKDISYLDSLSVEQLEHHIKSLRYSFSGHLSATQLRNYCMPLIKKLMDHQFGWVFSSPVDPVALNIPDYFQVIKCPMDLGTIKKRLDQANYYSSVDAVSKDVCLTFENCIAYNEDSNEFNILARDLLAQFQSDMADLKALIDKKLEQRFIDNEKDMCQLCGGDSFKFAPNMLFCNGVCRGRIRRHTHYYSDAKNEFHWCANCYKDMKEGEEITASIQATSITIKKEDMLKQKNSDVVEEPWVECDSCKKWYHQICALFNERNNSINGEADPFLCPVCVLKYRKAGRFKPSEGLNASRLPQSRLTKYLQTRTIESIRKAANEEERKIGKPMDMTGLDASGITIREVLSAEKKVEVKDRMKKIYEGGKKSLEYPFRSRCICVFQKIDGVDVLLFTLYVQEYGDACEEPNRRRVYISYLDSVNYFQPKKFRTLMHQEIIIGCLEDARLRGFHTAHIWSCPPLKGDDYIFFCKPENQKIPKASRLRQWYVKLLNRATEEGTVFRISNLYAEYYEKMKVSHELPYFEGDYWPNLAEELMKQLEEEAKEEASGNKKPKAKSDSKSKKSKAVKSKSKKSKGGSNGKGGKEKEEEKIEIENPDEILQKLKHILLPQKDDFFVCELQPFCRICEKPIITGKLWTLREKEVEEVVPEEEKEEKKEDEIKTKTRNEGVRKVIVPTMNRVPRSKIENPSTEYYCAPCHNKKRSSLDTRVRKSAHTETPLEIVPSVLPPLKLKIDSDPLMPNDVFDTRESFLTYCQSNHCQFDQLRRAKHSSMMILYHLFNQDTVTFIYNCSQCEMKLEKGNRWNCSVCPDYNLCDRCKVKTRHEHSLTPISCAPPKKKASGAAAGSAGGATQPRRLDPALLKLIEHSSVCQNPSCTPNCLRMRALLKHGATCEAKISGKCQTCRRIVSILKLHATHCRREICRVPRCHDIREHLHRLRLQQQQLQERRQTSLIEGAARIIRH